MKNKSGRLIILNLILIVAPIFLDSSCDTSSKVESRAYDFVLDIILTDTVPSVSVDSLFRSDEDMVLLDAREKKTLIHDNVKTRLTSPYESIRSIRKSPRK